MKNINISTAFFEKVSVDNESLSFERSLNEILIDNLCDEKNFCVVSYVSALSTDEDPDLKKKYDVMWTFGCLDETNEFANKKLGETIFDPSMNKKDKVIGVTSKCFTNQVMVIWIDDYVFKNLGQYYLKVYLKEHDSDESVIWELQSMNLIEVKLKGEEN